VLYSNDVSYPDSMRIGKKKLVYYLTENLLIVPWKPFRGKGIFFDNLHRRDGNCCFFLEPPSP
jgi:hypothetical protein